ncbi:MAG: bacterial transcriptional activator domain-containing protein [Pseudomonadota bacterium]
MAALALVAAIAGCTQTIEEREKSIPKSVIDAAELTDLLLTAGDPEEAVSYFQSALANEPDRADFRRGLAVSLARAKRYPESARVYQEMIALSQAEPADNLEYALVSARLDKWTDAESLIAQLPTGFNSARRHMAEGMLADHKKNWAEADAAYARAENLTTNPANILNNWGVSLMSRGDFPAAASTFERALSFNSRLFNAKNNLAIARGLQGNFQLPVVPMTETEKAIILNNLGLIAMRKNERRIAKGLFAAAVDIHPQHYREAADRLAALESVVEN